MYTKKEIEKAFWIWALSDFQKLPTLKEVQGTTDKELEDLLLASNIYRNINKKGG